MFKRQDIEEIRKRRNQQHRKVLLNRTMHIERPSPIEALIQAYSMSRRGPIVTSNVAKHIEHLGYSSRPRISLSLKPVGHRESKTVFRKGSFLKPVRSVQRPVSDDLLHSVERNHASPQEVVPVYRKPDKLRDSNPQRVEDCHSLCLPEWMVERLRSIWVHFTEAPPKLNGQDTEPDQLQDYTFDAVRKRLRKAKASVDMNLDKLFAQLGLDVSSLQKELCSTSLDATEKAERSSSPLEGTRAVSELQSPIVKPNSFTIAERSPVQKKICRVLDYLNNQYDAHQSYHVDERASGSTVGSLRTQSLSSISLQLSPIVPNKKPHEMGMDMLTLKLCNMQSRGTAIQEEHKTSSEAKKSMTRRVNPKPHKKKATIGEPHVQNEVAGFAKRLRDNPSLPKMETIRDVLWEEEGNQMDFIDHIGHSMKPTNLNFSTQKQRQKNQPGINLSKMSHSFIISPSCQPIKRTHIPTSYGQDRGDQSQRIQSLSSIDSIVAPIHPMWDTPEELRTSVNFDTFHM
ncbi:uncharacterized protein DEA37_0009261 [Paragonimus westermani]|uniref:Uncharacterized protein n=1 Tax=Paragonimus westermani TaxID=34504 RepID=A0A5J4NHN6_9TREM|nr:uncharacterized protein DEA37_0009261 [Paragonimus westermani]